MRLAELAAEAAIISLHGSVPSPAKQKAKPQETKQGARVEASRGGEDERSSGQRNSGEDASEGEGSMLAAMPAEVAMLVRRVSKSQIEIRLRATEGHAGARRHAAWAKRAWGWLQILRGIKAMTFEYRFEDLSQVFFRNKMVASYLPLWVSEELTTRAGVVAAWFRRASARFEGEVNDTWTGIYNRERQERLWQEQLEEGPCTSGR